MLSELNNRLIGEDSQGWTLSKGYYYPPYPQKKWKIKLFAISVVLTESNLILLTLLYNKNNIAIDFKFEISFPI